MVTRMRAVGYSNSNVLFYVQALGSKGSAQEQHHKEEEEEEEEEIISVDEDIKLFNLRHTFSPSQEETEDGRSPSSEVKADIL